jgi:hypothetical protein
MLKITARSLCSKEVVIVATALTHIIRKYTAVKVIIAARLMGGVVD